MYGFRNRLLQTSSSSYHVKGESGESEGLLSTSDNHYNERDADNDSNNHDNDEHKHNHTGLRMTISPLTDEVHFNDGNSVEMGLLQVLPN